MGLILSLLSSMAVWLLVCLLSFVRKSFLLFRFFVVLYVACLGGGLSGIYRMGHSLAVFVSRCMVMRSGHPLECIYVLGLYLCVVYVAVMIHGLFLGSRCLVYFRLLLYLVSGNCYAVYISWVEQRHYWKDAGCDLMRMKERITRSYGRLLHVFIFNDLYVVLAVLFICTPCNCFFLIFMGLGCVYVHAVGRDAGNQLFRTSICMFSGRLGLYGM